jgi:hypothetical protein
LVVVVQQQQQATGRNQKLLATNTQGSLECHGGWRGVAQQVHCTQPQSPRGM